MTKKESKPKRLACLTKKTEKKLRSGDSVGKMSSSDVNKLIHELQVHQIELEMQNEALKNSMMEIEEARRKYCELFDFAPVGYFTLDKNGLIIEANLAGSSLLGFEREALIETSRPFHNFVTASHFGIIQSHFEMILNSQLKHSCRVTMTKKDNSAFGAMIETIAVRDSEGQIDHYLCAVTDITEITRTEEALRESEKRYRHIVEDSMEFVGRASANGTITFVNEALLRYTGMRREELLGRNVADFIPSADREAFFTFLRSLTAENQTADIEQRVLSPDGDIRWHLWTVRAIFAKGGRFIEFQGTGRDITGRKRSEQELIRRQALLEEANKEMESFSYSVSHDLRAPLRAIDGYARMLLKKHGHEFDEDSLRKFNVIRSSTHMMGQLIDDLLTLSRLGRKQLSMSKIDMEALIREVWKELEVNPSRSIDLTVDGMPPAYGDRTLIKQVYSNLLANAVKFTKYKDSALVEVGGYIEGNDDVYYVKDNGVGFDMTYYDKLFGVFQRLHKADEFEGTGIGLATVQRIIRRHGGKVWAEGKEGEGATIYFSLSPPEIH